MEALALYLIKSTVWLTGFALVYLLFLRNERFFLLNRIYLVSGILVSIVFPLFTWHYTVMMANAPTVEVSELQMMGTADIPKPFPTQAILLCIYLTGALYLLFRVTRQTLAVLKVIRKSEILPYRSAKLIRTTDYPASFSFFSFVFVNPSTCDTEINEIVNHELEHIRQQHWIDLLLFEILCTLQWFNPLSWLYGHFIRQNHEFLADERALQRTSNPGIYRAALLNQLFGGPVISLANSFNYSINKKRFNMMKQTINSPIRKFKLLLVLPLMAGVFFAFATPEYKYSQTESNSIQEEVFTNSNTTNPESVTTLNSNFVAPASKDTTALYFIDGQESTKAESDKINPDMIESVSILKGEQAISKYGENGKNGVVLISMKKGAVENVNVNSSTSQILKVQTNASLKFSNLNGSSAQPLVVIDGVIATDQNVNNINPETIKSISVLKGESSTTLYGDKGKEGVVLITTKKGPYGIINEPIDVKITGLGTAKIKNIQKGSQPYTIVEQMPTFPGGNKALRNFLATNIRYPASAHESGIQGKVFIKFVVAKTGTVTNIEVVRGVDPSLDQEVTVTSGARPSQSVVRGVDPSLDKEAMRVVESLPNWIPGKQNGENVDVEYTIPINFVLEPSEISTEKLKGTDSQNEQAYTIVEQMPEFPGGEEALRNFMAANVKYPAIAQEKGIEGKVFIKFVVTKTGKVTNAKVVRSIDPLLNTEAIRVVELLPTWKPGMQNGKNVDVEYTIPVNFKLEKETKPAVDQTAQKHELIIVPNPTNDKATVTLKGSDSTNKLTVSVYDSYGKLIMKESKNGPSFTLLVAKLTTGTYLVVANDGTNKFQGYLVVNH